jgi:hypothetical protein
VLAESLPAEVPEQLFSMLAPGEVTGCILSALLSATRPELPPTIGLVDPADGRRHLEVLESLGFTAADLAYEGVALDPAGIAAFRARTSPLAAVP